LFVCLHLNICLTMHYFFTAFVFAIVAQRTQAARIHTKILLDDAYSRSRTAVREVDLASDVEVWSSRDSDVDVFGNRNAGHIKRRKAAGKRPDPAAQHVLTLSGLTRDYLNTRYYERKDPDMKIGAKSTFWSSDAKRFMFWCSKFRDWRLAAKSQFQKSKLGACRTYASNPNVDPTTPPMKGWKEFKEGTYEARPDAMVTVEKKCGSYQEDSACSAAGCRWLEGDKKCIKQWAVFGRPEVQYTDIQQGDLGTCYVFAVVASIAQTRPKIITDMFVDRHLWYSPRPVFTTKWLVTGEPKKVAIDDWLPVNAARIPVFGGFGARNASKEQSITFGVGDHVQAYYMANRVWYTAAISAVNYDGTYQVSWDDGDTADRVKTLSELSLISKARTTTAAASSASRSSAEPAIMWPLIIEKAWAKVFGNYAAIEWGSGAEAFRALTQAPIDILVHDQTLNFATPPDTIWEKIRNAEKQRLPMYAQTSSNVSKELGQLHAYAVLGTSERMLDGKMERLVRVFNPWGAVNYEKEVPNTELDISFDIRFSDFLESFMVTQVAQVEEGYVVSPTILSRHSEHVVVKAEFEMKGDDAFVVQLQWPSHRMVETAGCEALSPAASIEVVDEHGHVVVATPSQESTYIGMASIQARMPGRKGNYTVYVFADFPKGPWLKRLILNTYASEDVVFKTASPGQPTSVELEGFGRMSMNGKYTWAPDDLRRTSGDYHYWSGSGKYYLHWCRSRKAWGIARKVDLEKNDGDRCLHLARAPASRGLLSERMTGWTGWRSRAWHDETEARIIVSNDTIHAERNWLKDTSVTSPGEVNVTTFSKEKEECRKLVKRLDKLDNAGEIKAGGEDLLFPRSIASISPSGSKIGDGAQGISKDAETYNDWRTITDIMEQETP